MRVHKAYGTNYGQSNYDRIMTTYAQAYMQDPTKLNVRGIPVVPARNVVDTYMHLPSRAFTQGGARAITAGVESPKIQWTFGTDKFHCLWYGLAIDSPEMSQQVRPDDHGGIDYERINAEILVQNFALDRYQRTYGTLMELGVWDQEWDTPAMRFDSPDFSPQVWFHAMMLQMLRRSGGAGRPNTLILGAEAYVGLLQSPGMHRLLPPNGDQFVDDALIKRVFTGIQEIVVLEAVADSSNPGADPDPQLLHAKDALFIHNAPNNMRATAATIFQYDDPQMPSFAIREFTDSPRHQKTREILACYDVKVTAPSLGAFVKNAVA